MTDQKPSMQDDMREAASRFLAIANLYPDERGFSDLRRLAARLVAHAAAMDAARPVAWRWLDTAHYRERLPKNAKRIEWVPLYAVPQPPASQVVEAWQPIETAPKDGTLIVALWDNRERISSRNCSTIYWDGDWIFNNRRITTPTHWRPIPANLTGAANG